MNLEEEIEFLKKNGFCPHVDECEDSNGCSGEALVFHICRAPHITPEQLLPENPKEKVLFT